MATQILYRHPTNGFRIEKREEKTDSDISWEYGQYAFLCEKLIEEPEARPLFLDIYLKSNPPLLLADPDKQFDKSFIPPVSAFFSEETIVLFKEGDDVSKEALRKLAQELKSQKFLTQDILSIIKCKDKNCGYFSVGGGDVSKKKSFFCSKCGNPVHERGITNNKITKTFSFSPELRDLLFKQRGKILEGIIYTSFIKDANIRQRFDVISSPYLKFTYHESGQEMEGSHELDVVLIDKTEVILPIVILASLSGNQAGETRQVERCDELGMHVIFVCPKGVGDTSSIQQHSTVVDNILRRPNFPQEIVTSVNSYL